MRSLGGPVGALEYGADMVAMTRKFPVFDSLCTIVTSRTEHTGPSAAQSCYAGV